MSCPRCKSDENSVHFSGEIGNLIHDFMDSPINILRINDETGMPGIEIVQCFSCEQLWLVSYRYWEHPPLLLDGLAIRRKFLDQIKSIQPDILLKLRERGMLLAEFIEV